MKKLIATLIVGLILLYFIEISFKIDGLTQEMLIDNSVRFFLGFLVTGIWSRSEHKWKTKIYMYVFLVLLVCDVIYNYIQGISTLEIEMTLHDMFIFFWGALVSYFFVKYLYFKKQIAD